MFPEQIEQFPPSSFKKESQLPPQNQESASKDFDKSNQQQKEELLEKKFFEIAREKLLKRLKQDGILEQKKDLLVIDLDKFKNIIRDYNKLYLVRARKKTLKATVINIFNLLGDLPVVSKKDYEKAKQTNTKPEPKPLFNVPESIDEAFNIENIKNKQYYFNIWDIKTGNNLRWSQEIKAKNGEILRTDEFYLATLLYKDLQAKRANGDLLIFDKGKKQWRKISQDWLKKNKALSFLVHPAINNQTGIHNYLRNNCPNLLKKGLLKLDDFGIITSYAGGELLRKEFDFEKTERTDLKMVMIDGVRYYIGRNYFIYNNDKIPIENIKVSVLDPQTAGIVVKHEGREELKYVFDLLTEEEKKKTREKAQKRLGRKRVSANIVLNKEELEKRLRPYSAVEVIKRKPGESDEEYEKRRAQVSDYGYISRITKKFSYECGVGIHNLPWREQVWLAAAAYDFGVKGKEKELLSFAKKFGLPGLRTFLALESGELSGEQILAIGQQLKNQPQTADKLFAEFARLVDSAEAQAQELVKMYEEIFFDKKLDRDKANYAILRKAFALLNKASQDLAQAKKEQDKEKIISNLIADLRREEKVQKKAIEDLKGLQKELNKKYQKAIEEMDLVGLSKKERQEYEKSTEESEKYIKTISSDPKDKDQEALLDKINKHQIQFAKFDSKRLKKEIKALESNVHLSLEGYNHLVETEGKEFADNFRKVVEQEKKLQEPLLRQLKDLLILQQALEQKLDEFIYGNEFSSDLPAEVKGHFSYKVLEKYSQIVEQVKELRQSIKQTFKDEKNFSDSDLDNIAEHILTKASKILTENIEKIKAGRIDEKELLARLEAQKTDALVFASIFKVGWQKEKLSFTELRKVEYKSVLSLNLSEKEKEMIRQAVRLNYPKKDQQVDILAKIEKSFSSPKTIWHILTKQEKEQKELLACLRIDEIDKNTVYAASFNVGLPYRGSSLGQVMFFQIIDKIAKEKRIRAIAEVRKQVASFYINKGGFNVVGIGRNPRTDINYYRLERFDPENEYYGTKKIAESQKLLAYYDPRAKLKDLVKQQQYIIVKKDDQSLEQSLKDIEFVLSFDYKLTRIIQKDKEDYLVFEKPLMVHR